MDLLGSEQSRIDLGLAGAEAWLLPSYIPHHDALAVQLLDELDWQQPLVQVYGRRHKTPRLVCFYGDKDVTYRYSGVRHRALGWPRVLEHLRDRLHRDWGLRFNAVLCNAYRNGQDRMGWHSDNEAELGPDPSLASISLGADRRFAWRKVEPSGFGPSRPMELPGGSLLWMGKGLQARWQHGLPQQKACSRLRVNLTFRLIH